MSLDNGNFEIQGDETGCARGWVFAAHGQFDYAGFDDSDIERFDWAALTGFSSAEAATFLGAAFEAFQIGWSLEDFVTSIIGPVTALFAGASFEAFVFSEWAGSELIVDVSTPTVAQFGAVGVEAFQEGWYNMEDYVTDIVGATAAVFDSALTPQDVEDFEEGWDDLLLD